MTTVTVTVKDSAGHTATATAPVAVTRSSQLWPFHERSCWNMPIGSGAQFSGPFWQPPAVTRDNVNFDVEVIGLDPTAPLLPVYSFDRTNSTYQAKPWLDPNPHLLGFQLRVPVGLVMHDTDNSWCETNLNAAGGCVMADGHTIHEFNYGFVLDQDVHGPAPLHVRLGDNGNRGTLDLYGDGVETARGAAAHGGHGGSMLSGVGGSIRKGELFGPDPIRHALKMTGFMKGYGKRTTAGVNTWVWPAFMADGGNGYGTVALAGVTPTVPMGGLIAIPPTVNVATLGLETAPALKLAQAAQRFGIYLVDEGGSATWIAGQWCMEWGVGDEGVAHGVNLRGTKGTGGMPNPWSRDHDRILSACRLVINNGPNSIGGGGTPLYQMAPPLT
jgi:hypothetical protein